MFDKILIANRGEIACRIMRTAARLNIQTVAVYSAADRQAMHTRLADQAVAIGPAPVKDSYLVAENIIQAALDTKAQAIHPGYGFLSENPDFVDQIEAAGLVFIGPSSKAIRAMGLKDAAKALMEQAGVPVVPGYHGNDQTPEFLHQQAQTIGYPVLIKARAGGGGKGMRYVKEPDGFLAALASAQREALASFADDRVLIEKYIACPRHIELQIFGDTHGNLVHLFERDCSLQRRHQKVIEEAPAPGMSTGMRQAMGNAAIEAARTIDYTGAGTVEFIVDSSGGLQTDRFYFMEMNTRLQVEHPVTEAITGCDLVEWQLRVAAGEPLPVTQEALAINGWAMQARVYAEDVASGFLPSTGVLHHLVWPDAARVDTGVRSSDSITTHYDPMIAKIITHGTTRQQARERLIAALRQTQAAGAVITNINFLIDLLDLPPFAEARIDTGLIERHPEIQIVQAEPPSQVLALAAVHQAVLSANMPSAHSVNQCDTQSAEQSAIQSLAESLSRPGSRSAFADQAFIGFHLWQPLLQRVTLLDEQARSHRCGIQFIGADRIDICVNQTVHTLCYPNGNQIELDGQIISSQVISHPGGISVFAERAWHFTRPDVFTESTTTANSTDHVLAPMPGQIRLVSVAEGDQVKTGQAVIVMEAMKMEQTLNAPRDGRVQTLVFNVGDQVDAGAVLLSLQPESE